MKIPDFFVVGAPRCGTTAFHSYFEQHPDIHVLPKEHHYFGSDLVYSQPRVTEQEYQALLEQAPADKTVGDIAIWYMMSTEAASEIHAFAPDAKIILLLRDPVEQAYSLHRQLHYGGFEDIEDFSLALDAADARRHGERLPPHYRVPRQAFDYLEVPRFAPQVARWFETVGKDRCHVILLEEFSAEPQRVFRACLEFLEVDPSFDPGFDVVNASQRVVSEKMRNLVFRPPAALRGLARALKLSPATRMRIKHGLRRWNTRPEKRSPLEEDVRARLIAHFRPDVDRLQDLLGRDLSNWLK